jgi:hypothetical protein
VIFLPAFLTDLEIDEVSLVEKGANNKKIIFKSFEDSDMTSTNKEETKAEEETISKSAENVETVIKEASPAPADVEKEGEEKRDEEDEKEPEGEVSKSLVKKMAQTEKALENARIEKAALAQEVEQIRKALQDELNRRILKEHIEKASVEYVRLGKPDDVGLIMKEASEKLSPEIYGKLSGLMKTANARIEAGLFQEVGKSGFAPGSSVVEKVRAIAKSYVEKSAGSMTMAQAEARAWADNPDLYMQYQSERHKVL